MELETTGAVVMALVTFITMNRKKQFLLRRLGSRYRDGSYDGSCESS